MCGFGGAVDSKFESAECFLFRRGEMVSLESLEDDIRMAAALAD